MENEIQIFNNIELGKVRTLIIDGEPYFVGKDVAEILGYARPTKAIHDNVDEEDKDEIPVEDSIGRMQKTPIINESGLYSLILSSKLPNAKKFKRWVTSEVLPQIRRTGEYKTNLKKYEDIIKQQQDMIKHLEICVGLTDKMTKGYSKYIKNRLNILRVNNKYRVVVNNLFDFFAVERWEQIAILDSEMVFKKIDEITDTVNKCIQMGFKL